MHKKCAWCGSEASTVVYVINDKSIIKCDNCSLMQTYPQPSVEELSKIYSEEYFCNKNLIDPKSNRTYGYYDYLSERLIKQSEYANILRLLSKYLENNNVTDRKLLDVGCGYGFFLDASLDYGFDPIGIEFSEHARRYIAARYAFPVYSSDISALDLFGRESIGSVTLLDTLEHLQNPFRALKEIHEILLPGGILIVTTMDSSSFMSRLLGARLEDFRRVHEHLFFFDKNNIKTILNENNFKLIKVASIGHTFEFGNLMSRVSAMIPFLSPIRSVVKLLRLEHIRVSFNPRTKIIVYAMKNGGKK